MRIKVKTGTVVERIRVPDLGKLLITHEITLDRYAVWFSEYGELYEIETVRDSLSDAKKYVSGFLEGAKERGF